MPDDVVIDATPDSSTGAQDTGYEGYDQIAATETPAVETGAAVPATPAATEPGGQEQVPFHNHPRWQEVNRQLQAYRQYGDPATVAERLQQRQAYETYILSQWQQARQPQAKGAETQLSAEDAEVRDKIISLFPHLKTLEKQTADLSNQVVTQQRAIVSRGREALTGYANYLGVSNPLGHQAMENAITAIIESNDGALERFKGGDSTIINHAIAALDAYVFEPIRRAAITQYVSGKQKTVGLPRTAGTNTQGIPVPANRHKPVADMSPQEQLDLEWSILNSDRK